MPAYAVFGATGNVGQAIVQILSQSPDNEIHAYCRSKAKLLKLLPDIEHNKHAKVFEGSLDDNDLLCDCLQGTRAAFIAIAQAGNKPKSTLSQDTAKKIVNALQQLKSQKKVLPKLVVLSSASTEHRLMAGSPQFLLDMLYRAFSDKYDDLKVAEQIIRDQESLVTASFIKPGALSHDAQNGHALSLTEARSPVSFRDLAAGMIEVADDSAGTYDMKAVAVNATGDVAFPYQAPLFILKGLIVHFFPFMYRIVG